MYQYDMIHLPHYGLLGLKLCMRVRYVASGPERAYFSLPSCNQIPSRYHTGKSSKYVSRVLFISSPLNLLWKRALLALDARLCPIPRRKLIRDGFECLLLFFLLLVSYLLESVFFFFFSRIGRRCQRGEKCGGELGKGLYTNVQKVSSPSRCFPGGLQPGITMGWSLYLTRTKWPESFCLSEDVIKANGLFVKGSGAVPGRLDFWKNGLKRDLNSNEFGFSGGLDIFSVLI